MTGRLAAELVFRPCRSDEQRHLPDLPRCGPGRSGTIVERWEDIAGFEVQDIASELRGLTTATGRASYGRICVGIRNSLSHPRRRSQGFGLGAEKGS